MENGKRIAVVIGLALSIGALSAQTGPRLQWDIAASSASSAAAYSYELWINGVGQLPLRAATCAGTSSPFVCTDTIALPTQPEGIRTLQLLAVSPQGIRSVLSASFPVTYPASPANLRFAP